MKKLTYQEQVRNATASRLIMNRKLTGPERRRLFRARETVLCRGGESDEKPSAQRFAERFARRPWASLNKWYGRVTKRLVVVERGIEAAMEAGLTKVVDVLSVKRDRFVEFRDALKIAINLRNTKTKTSV